MDRPSMTLKSLAFMAACAGALGGCGNSAEPGLGSFRPALEAYLEKNGNLCLGKFDWPIGVSERDSRLRTRDAVQMPVLEKIGIVVSAAAVEKRSEGGVEKVVPVRRYELTEAGRKFYLAKETEGAVANGKRSPHHGDFCAGKLSLDAIVGWEPPQSARGHKETTVTYTYRIAAAEWARNPEAQKVFPMVERMIKGERTLQLQQLFRQTGNGWQAVVSPG
jgi:hypothetical protein